MKRYDSYKDSGIEWIGVIPSHWDKVLFKRVIQKIKDGTHGSFSRVLEGRPFLSAKNVYDFGLVISENESLISEEDFNEITKNGFPSLNDLLITCVGTIGRTCVYKYYEPYAFQRSVSFLRLNQKGNPNFYKCFVQSDLYQNQLLNLAKTSAQSGVYMSDLANSIVLLPPINEQTAIANFLDQKTTQIDDLIAKKERLIQLLEEERTAIINQAVTKGLDPTVPMKDSGIEWLGEIPEHWEVKKLKYVANLIPQKTSQKPEYVIALENIESWTGKIIGNPFENEMQGEAQLFEKGDVLFNKLRPYLAKVTLADKMGGAMGELLILRPNEFVTSEFLFQRLRSEMVITVVDGSTYGTKMPRASWDKFISLLEFGIPTIKEQNEIVEFISNNELNIDSLSQKYQQEIELLKEYKTALISEVVTGKVDVRNEKLN